MAGVERPIRDKIELRMRALGLESVETQQYGAGTFVVEIAVSPPPKNSSGHIRFEYRRTTYYEVGARVFFGDVAAWRGAQAYMFGDLTRERFMRAFPDSEVDGFLNAYLKANAPASK